MNMWIDDDQTSMTDAFSTLDLTSLPPPPPPAISPFKKDTLRQRLQALIDVSSENWTYAIFWKLQNGVLVYGDGHFKGEHPRPPMPPSWRLSAEEKAFRKKFLLQLNSLITGASPSEDNNAIVDQVTDMEWFLILSMMQSFPPGCGLVGRAMEGSAQIWVIGSGRRSALPCERALQGLDLGLRTMFCVPVANGVVELGSTRLTFQTSEVKNRLGLLFEGTAFLPEISPHTRRERLQALIDGSGENWTYANFWEPENGVLVCASGYYTGKDRTASLPSCSAKELAHRRKVLRELISSITSEDYEDAIEVSTDLEWFLIVSDEQSFAPGCGLLGRAMESRAPIWVGGAERLAGSACERARQGQGLGLRTMLCIPAADGVVELGSTEVILQTSDVMNTFGLQFVAKDMGILRSSL